MSAKNAFNPSSKNAFASQLPAMFDLDNPFIVHKNAPFSPQTEPYSQDLLSPPYPTASQSLTVRTVSQSSTLSPSGALPFSSPSFPLSDKWNTESISQNQTNFLSSDPPFGFDLVTPAHDASKVAFNKVASWCLQSSVSPVVRRSRGDQTPCYSRKSTNSTVAISPKKAAAASQQATATTPQE
ncbi:hypothetical protein M422DRAFT_50372 [Sphaerobolus stellatus SS14]|uniref:Uncharacterized protein n=1 Tax=Sphaerobolus stellatus (strain SS14) TaxID=990650 RepID=A0A0C9URW1_SPHS4|nr:hypothetical protein M422DRAFT_50372 [Sphaerobolus stellatus SS14]